MRGFVHSLALLLLVLPVRGSADIVGRIGLVYTRFETWTPTAHYLTPQLQLDGYAAANGPLVYQEYGSWRGSVGYQQLRRTSSEASDERSTLTYSADVSALPVTAPLSLSLNASRTATDASAAGTSTTLTGTQVATSYGGQFNFDSRSAPAVAIGGSIVDSTQNGYGVEPVDEITKRLHLSTRHGPGPYDFGFSYDGTWNEANVDLRNYASHSFDVGASSWFRDGLVGFLTGRYFLRVPGTTTLNNPRYEVNTLVTGLRNNRETGRTFGQYAYEHQFFSSASTGELERIRHTVSGTHEVAHSKAWQSSWTVSGTVDQDRAGGLEQSAYEATLAPVARWRHEPGTRNLMLEAGPLVGVLKEKDGATELGSGAHWRGTVQWNRAARYALDYAGDYGNNLQATHGWSLRQALSATLDGALGSARGRGTVTVSAVRQHLDVLGENAARDVVLRANLDWRRISLQLDAGLRDGTSPSIGGTRGDGLFIPSSFDSHSQSAAVFASVALSRRLTASTFARYARLSGADVVAQQEAAFHGTLQLAVGQVVLSLEDRYSVGGPEFGLRINEVWVRLSRSFNLR